ncbi:hypothetical protein B0H19DRAFT_1072625 [Mycena capillaripes]|nr:hypothetical protein B0H19DRAFT_1072625 [Mycena capillaripes]
MANAMAGVEATSIKRHEPTPTGFAGSLIRSRHGPGLFSTRIYLGLCAIQLAVLVLNVPCASGDRPIAHPWPGELGFTQLPRLMVGSTWADEKWRQGPKNGDLGFYQLLLGFYSLSRH